MARVASAAPPSVKSKSVRRGADEDDEEDEDDDDEWGLLLPGEGKEMKRRR